MRLPLVACLIVVGFSVAPTTSAVCVCPSESVDPIWAAERAALIFLGKAERTGAVRGVKDFFGQLQRQVSVTFLVERTWKGVSVSETAMVMWPDDRECLPALVTGKKYVVFAFAGSPRAYPFESGGDLYVRTCSPCGNASSVDKTVRSLDCSVANDS